MSKTLKNRKWYKTGGPDGFMRKEPHTIHQTKIHVLSCKTNKFVYLFTANSFAMSRAGAVLFEKRHAQLVGAVDPSYIFAVEAKRPDAEGEWTPEEVAELMNNRAEASANEAWVPPAGPNHGRIKPEGSSGPDGSGALTPEQTSASGAGQVIGFPGSSAGRADSAGLETDARAQPDGPAGQSATGD